MKVLPPSLVQKTKTRLLAFAVVPALFFVLNGLPAATAASPAPERPNRLVVLTDIEADPDDTESLVRLFLYTDVIDLEGLVAATSTWKRTSIAPDSIRAVIRAYGKVQGNLLQHDPKFPAADKLLALIKSGRPEYGMLGVGAGKDTEGSEWILHCLAADDPRPLWVTLWGGANTLAQALYKARATLAPEQVDALVAKLRVYAISDQDDAGPWIRKNFPTLFYIVSPGGDYSTAIWPGINAVVPGLDNTSVSNKWIAENIQQGHGPLGAAYPDIAWGMEGDTPSWLGLIPNGLNAPEHPNWGGWGGRYELAQPEIPVTDPKTFIGGVPIGQETRPIWTNAIDEYIPPRSSAYGRPVASGETSYRDAQVTLWRWREDIQNDFAARMTWCTKPYGQANHPPVPVLDHPAELTVHSGEGFVLSAHASTDPDGDSLSFYWFQYPEAGTPGVLAKFDGPPNSAATLVIAPKVDRPATLHFILRLTDKGTPPLSRYQRVIVNVVP